MNKCRLCQKLNNTLIRIYNGRMKSLAELLLKLKGFMVSLDVKESLTICENCKQDMENVATFWENIPEANTDNTINTDKLEELKEQKPILLSKGELFGEPKQYEHLPTKTITVQKQYEHVTSHTGVVTKLAPIKIRIKLPRKRKIKDKPICTTAARESAEKRMRRLPKHYENYILNCSHKIIPSTEVTTTNILNEPQVAVLRSTNGQDIGKLMEVESKGRSSKMRIICQICCQIFRFERDFQKHLKSHNKNMFEDGEDCIKNYMFYCKLCDKSFTEHYVVRKHFRHAHSEDRPLKCQHCEASFKYNFNLNYHMAKHVAKKRFECVFCKKMFLMRYELKIHLRTHTKEKPYKCEFCSFAFAHRSNLKAHQKVKHFKESNIVEEKIKTNIFKPPQNLIENEMVMQLDLNDETFKESTNIEEKLINNTFKPSKNRLQNEMHSDLNDERVFISENSANPINFKDIENLNILKSPQDFTEKEMEVQPDESNGNFSNFTSPNDFKNDKIKINSPRATKLFLECIAEAESELISKNDKILKFSEVNETCRESLKVPAKLGIFQLDSRIFKVLPSATLLGLKKWPKSYQGISTPPLNQSNNSTFLNVDNLNSFKIDKTTRLKNGEYVYENTSDNMAGTSIMKYNPLQTNYIENSKPNSTQITNNKSSSYNTLNAPQPDVISNSSNSNLKITNYKVFSEGEFINISKLRKTSTSMDNGHLSGVNQIQNMDNKCTTTENSLNLQYNLLETNDYQPSKVLEVSSTPVKIKNILNLKTSAANSFTSNLLASRKVDSISKTAKEVVTKFKDDFLIQNSEITKGPEFSGSRKPNINISTRSLLKPVLKTQEISILSLTSPKKNQTTISAKPLITKIEILPPLKILPNLQKKLTLANAPINIVKPPMDYKHQCPYCYKYFKQKSSLTKHIRTHTGEKPYKCNLCPKSYADASNYKKHKILHKNAAEALNITTTTANAIQNSPAYSTVSDPDPDGIEVMQTIKKFGCSFSEDEEEIDDDASLTSSSTTMESNMWHDVLEHALTNEELRRNIKRNLADINNAILPKSIQQLDTK